MKKNLNTLLLLLIASILIMACSLGAGAQEAPVVAEPVDAVEEPAAGQ